MTIRVALSHVSEYQFDRDVVIHPHEIRLRPAVHTRTPIHAYSLKIEPKPHWLNWQQDPFGNFVGRVVFPEKAPRLKVVVEVIADMTVINPFDFFVEDSAEFCPFDYEKARREELAPYLQIRESGPRLMAWVKAIDRARKPTNDFLVEINQRLAADIGYRIRMEPGVQTCEETLTLANGSCRDSAWLLVQIFRHLGIAARFCSGYLVQLAPDQRALDGPSGPTEDFTDLHAWCEVFVPGAGWLGLDPTSGLFAGEGHIPLACTPDPGSAAPITGATSPCEVEFTHANIVTRILETPRVTKPYTRSQWRAIDALGQHVDEQLDALDVRLTMGGEPTFVSTDDMESAQWNVDALGEDKLRLAKDLVLRLRDRFAPGAVLHCGQGKWYPGEELPRWALGVFWRNDGVPVWRDPALLARIDEPGDRSVSDSKRFALALAERLRVDSGAVRAAYEDPFEAIGLERALPVDLDPTSASLDDTLERRRLADLLERGLSTPRGYVLPLDVDPVSGAWCTSKWVTRSSELLLIPGDSPMGFRLPLGSIAIQTPSGPTSDAAAFQVPARDPFAVGSASELEPLTEQETGAESASAQTADRPNAGGPISSATHAVFQALCVEVREGRLHLFLPPTRRVEDYLALVAIIEDISADLGFAVMLEGYTPPRDPRLIQLLVTPDPGVIEVNIHPAKNWSELSKTTFALYEEARAARLTAEKFMLDGRHVGTGGGNHVTIGAATPADSPLLRRPDLLGSLLTYWQHHPALSYLFSGMFIGPTSQAPRVDEGRHESLYELEIALSQVPEGEVPEPWLVDRLFRNLLVDITGNTHRAEFCIDKLYSPGAASGRQGLLEFRGFEMPPHPEMSLVQMLLLRAIVTRLWREPYRHPLVRWGSELHDRFMLPHFVRQDAKEVIDDLERHGIAFKLEWLEPFLEFRFPTFGQVQINDVSLEIRWAIEPWHVLGEEVGSFGTSRYVDSSMERLQVRLGGLTGDRYLLVCNGRRVPLRNTGTAGDYVAGIRYRAWQPPSALHPRIGIQSPLVFDIFDTWNERSIGGCTYHVTHPGGRSYDVLPVNAFEAEARRVNRFSTVEHSAATVVHDAPMGEVARTVVPEGLGVALIVPPEEEPSMEYPYTLDLRRQPGAIG